MKNKERIAYIGVAASLLLGGVACGKQLKLVDAPTPTPITTADKPKETSGNGAIAEQIAELAKLITEQKGSERIITIIVPSAPAVPEQPASKQAEQSAPVAPAASKDESIATPKVDNYWETPYNHAATKSGESWILHNSDGAEVKMNLDSAIGFTPDADLKKSDITPKALGIVPTDAGDFQAYLNKPREGFGPLAGYTDGTNDYNQYKDHQSGPQVPVYSWMVHTGLNVELPGIGRVVGGPGRAAMVLIINRTERVYRFPTNSVKVVAGFQGWGRIWDGSANTVAEAEKRLDNHYRSRLGQGVPETGFIGQCDQASNNCDGVTIVAVERIQWGNNSDGTPRDQFRLIRAETIAAAK